jgi:hypothetical protein
LSRISQAHNGSGKKLDTETLAAAPEAQHRAELKNVLTSMMQGEGKTDTAPTPVSKDAIPVETKDEPTLDPAVVKRMLKDHNHERSPFS